MFEVTFSHSDGGQKYTTQPMSARKTIAFLFESHNQGLILVTVNELEEVKSS